MYFLVMLARALLTFRVGRRTGWEVPQEVERDDEEL